MSQVQITLTFANAVAATAFLTAYAASSGATNVAQGVQGNASGAPTADTSRTAAAAPAAAPAQNVPTSTALDFDRDVVPALKSLMETNKAKFGAMMQHYGFANANDVKAKPDLWAELIGHCKA